MTTKSVQALGAGCGQSIVIQLLATAGLIVALGGCMLLATIVPLPSRVDRSWVFIGALVFASFGSIAAALIFAVAVLVRRGRRLDAAFAPLGISGQPYLTNGRQYHGTFGGRRLDAYFYRGPTLEIYLGTPLKTRLGVSAADRLAMAVAGLANKTPLAVSQPALQHLTFYALDEQWASQLAADRVAQQSLLRLLDEKAPGAGAFEIRQVLLQPESGLVRLLHTRVDSISAENVRAWTNDLANLLRAAEALPPPAVTAEPTSLERNSRMNRNAFLLPAVLIVVGLVAVLAVCGIAPAVFILLVDASGR